MLKSSSAWLAVCSAVMCPQTVRCTRGARTPGVSWVWGGGTLVVPSPHNISGLCPPSRWFGSPPEGSGASPSPCPEACSAGAGTTEASSDWGTRKVEMLYFCCSVFYEHFNFNNLFPPVIDRYTPACVHRLNLKKACDVSCGRDHTAVLTKVGLCQSLTLKILIFFFLIRISN